MSSRVISSVAGSTPRIARREEIGARVVGAEELGHMEARGRGEGPARGRARVIRQVRGVGRVASDRVVPAGRSPHRAEYQHALELGQGQWVVLRLEGERAIRDLVAEREAARTTAVKGRQQGEIGDPVSYPHLT